MGPEGKEGVEGEGQTGERRKEVHDQQRGWGRPRDGNEKNFGVVYRKCPDG